MQIVQILQIFCNFLTSLSPATIRGDRSQAFASIAYIYIRARSPILSSELTANSTRFDRGFIRAHKPS
ncbi:hypothetical protein [Oxynema aestuarii]|uniref:Uncharacterized protein n=1 Tax=Oxynema aestuarii AP17 TaxID=2064643 RepID=A0A6H1TZH4_9CYAN|nr:hypothetical protein [Oxynema aestuarii]QIZ71596.1 hypothetical protein HCG48_14210 [Oxynema aestuarii AP17]RMH72762.1 MAG: hypothetical protein D6680_18370 [Cyanobacteria bacterium J007]